MLGKKETVNVKVCEKGCQRERRTTIASEKLWRHGFRSLYTNI